MKKLNGFSITKDLIQKTFEKILEDMRKDPHIPVPYDDIITDIQYFRGCNTLGRCCHHRGKHTIKVNEAYLTGYMSEKSLRATLVHEIIHTFPRCNNHREEFQYWARIFSRKYGVDLGTKCSRQETIEFNRANLVHSKNISVCVDCGLFFLSPIMSPDVRRWMDLGCPTFRCVCRRKGMPVHKENILIIQLDGQALTDSHYCADSVRPRAEEWLEKHLPPEEYRKTHSFAWTPEAIEQEYWWEDDEDASLYMDGDNILLFPPSKISDNTAIGDMSVAALTVPRKPALRKDSPRKIAMAEQISLF